jgi:PEP-CTERM motif-containing protein
MTMPNRAPGGRLGTCLAVALGLILASTFSSATTITFGGTAFGPSGASSTVAGAQIQDFETGVPSNYTFSAGNTTGGIFQGSVPLVASPPANDTSHYMTSGVGSLTASYSTPINYFGLLWGTVDGYNSITLRSGSSSQTWTGSDILAAPGFTGVNGSAYVNFFATPGTTWNSITFSSSKANFEFDNAAISSVPEPAAVALIGLGFGLAGFGVFRRRKSGDR